MEHSSTLTEYSNSAGIGYETVKQLALRGAKVYVAARSQAKATASIDHLLKENKTISSTNLVWLPLDLSSLESVTKAAHEFCSAEKRLDILGEYFIPSLALVG